MLSDSESPAEEQEKESRDGQNGDAATADGAPAADGARQTLRERAEREVGSIGYIAARVIPVAVILAMVCLIAIEKSRSGRESVLFAVLAAGLIGAVTSFFGLQSGWEHQVRSRIAELIESRKEQMEEQRLFYSSPEWRLVRKEVVAEQGRHCRECGKYIRRNADLTVGHIKPRSEFPDLALDKTNLRVLCRQCNSSAGDAVPGNTTGSEIPDNGDGIPGLSMGSA